MQSLQKIIRDPIPRARLVWLHGPAGVGKSAVLQNLTEEEDARQTLGAGVFFSRPNRRNNPHKVFTTISYQLALRSTAYRAYLSQHITNNPTFLNKSITKQFEHLVVIPLARTNVIDSRVIFLDGLDELEGEREQARIINLIHDFVRDYPSIPISWVVASRPEPSIHAAFSHAGSHLCDTSSYWEMELQIDSEEGIRDVERFLHDEFARIKNDFPDTVPSHCLWPPERLFFKVLAASSGHFIFASTIIRYIDDPYYGNPILRLNQVVSILEKQVPRNGQGLNPFSALDALYHQIMEDIPHDVLPVTKMILGYIIISTPIVFPDYTWGGTVNVGNILGLESHIFYGALRKLHSVLKFPGPTNASSTPITFHHTSFADYLVAQASDSPYWLDLSATATRLWHKYLDTLRHWMEDHSIDNIELTWPPDDIYAPYPPPYIVLPGLENSPQEWLLYTASHSWFPLLLRTSSQSPTYTLQCTSDKLASALESLDFTLIKVLEPSESDFELATLISLQNDAFIKTPFDGIIGDSRRFFLNFRSWHLGRAGWNKLLHKDTLASLDTQQLVTFISARRWFCGGSLSDWGLDVNVLHGYGHSLSDLFFNWMNARDYMYARNRAFARLIDLVQDEEKVQMATLTVIGARPSKCRALVEAGDHFWIFPYFTPVSQHQ